MGVVKGGLFIVAGILLFILLLLSNLFLTLDWSLEYETIQPELKNVIRGIAEEQIDLRGEVEEVLPLMNIYCQTNSQYVFAQEGYTVVVPCEVVEQGSDAIIEHSIDYLVKDVYYEEYDCDFWDCFGKTGSPFFLVSAKAKDYWHGKFYLAVGISILLLVLMFFLSETKGNFLIIAGALIAGSALPFMKINWVLSLFSSQAEIFSSLFAKAYSVFLIMFVSGIVVLSAGIGLHFFNFGNFISKKVSGKEEDSEEVKKK